MEEIKTNPEIGQTSSYLPLSETKQKRAIAFIERLSDPESAKDVLSYLNETMRTLTFEIAETTNRRREQDYLIDQLCNLSCISDTIEYLAAINLLKPVEPWQEQRK